VSADLPVAVAPVCVEVVFHVDDERQAQTVAARMVDRAYEIANLPECECDVDVSVVRSHPDIAASAPVDAPKKL
jgi:hypothetical protein